MTIVATAPEMEGRLASVRLVRHRARDVLASWGLDGGDMDDTLYVVGELVANAAQHSPPGVHHVSLHLSPDGGSLVVTVHDLSRAMPYVPTGAEANPVALSGRGLLLVAGLSENWGAVPTAGGKKVWAEMRLKVPVPPPRRQSRTNQPVSARVLRRALPSPPRSRSPASA
ncbi:ATP-binding protein [Kitasatospora griseola]|uniref:ATP-binding protein n=1 Tax=Kitasatospora griseola TaxID=2064 RepID=UPI00166FC83C|nr:ATP-binding protein [Kitasatospora griseola]